MAFCINNVSISGNLTRQAEMKAENFLTFTVAVNNSKKDANGQWVKDPAFIDCTISGARAGALLQKLQKGAHVALSGSIWQNNWTDKQTGQKRSKLQVKVKDIDMLSKSDGGSYGASSYGGGSSYSGGDSYGQSDISDDDIPF